MTKEQIPPPADDQPFVIKAASTMLGDLMSCVLNLAKALPHPWHQLSEQEQDTWLQSVDVQLKTAVQDCVRIISSRGATTVPATVESMTFKNGAKVILKLVSLTDGAHQGAHEIADAIGEIVAITLSDTSELTGDDGKPQADPNQPGLLEGSPK